MNDIKKERVLKLNLIMENKNIKVTNSDSEEVEFVFSLEDKKTDKIDVFINYLLEKTTNFNKLEIDYKEIQDEIKDQVCKSFKKIWEEEFSNVVNEIQNVKLNNKSY